VTANTTQTAKHIVEECPECAIQGGMKYLHKVRVEATEWMSESNKT